MAKVFLDTNYLIDTVHRQPEKKIIEYLEGHSIYCSTLSFHIYCYVFKIKLPNKIVSAQKEKFQLVDFTENILVRSLNGPTSDFEDNVQLHSAVEGECDIFMTEDKKLLKMRFFGKIQISSTIS